MMQVAAELSLYPIADDFIPPIDNVIERLNGRKRGVLHHRYQLIVLLTAIQQAQDTHQTRLHDTPAGNRWP